MLKQRLWTHVVVLTVLFLLYDLFFLKWGVTHTIAFITIYIVAFLLIRFLSVRMTKKYGHLVPKEKIATTKSMFGAASIFMGTLVLVFGIYVMTENSETVGIPVGMALLIVGSILMYYSAKPHSLDTKRRMYSSHSVVIGALFLVFGIFAFIIRLELVLTLTLTALGMFSVVLGTILGRTKSKRKG